MGLDENTSFQNAKHQVVITQRNQNNTRFNNTMVLPWPRFNVGIQSTLNLSQLFPLFPEMKCRSQTRSFARICSVKSSRLIAEIHSERLPFDNFSASSPWFVTTEGTRKKFKIFLSSTFACTTNYQTKYHLHRTFTVSTQPRLFTLLVHQYGSVVTVARLLVTWVKTIYKKENWAIFLFI